MKKQKLTLLTIFLMAVFCANAQNGLQQILVEKYYVANATDAAQADGAASDAMAMLMVATALMMDMASMQVKTITVNIM